MSSPAPATAPASDGKADYIIVGAGLLVVWGISGYVGYLIGNGVGGVANTVENKGVLGFLFPKLFPGK